MITTFFDANMKETVPALVFKDIWSLEGVVSLRDALYDCLLNIVSYTEPKEGTKPYSLYLLTSVVNELTEDIEKEMKEKGGQS